MALSFLPFSSPVDPTEDPPVSIDPLGTLPLAERLAEELLPGITGRMWRARLLTFSAVASHVASECANGRDDRFLEARLVFERLFVMAALRKREPEAVPTPERAPELRRLPGVGLARTARRVDLGLTRSNFLRGQAVNGPFGVMARLARSRRVLDPHDHLDVEGERLLREWSLEQSLGGFLGDSGNGEPGRKWLADVRRAVLANIEKKEWPAPKSVLWEQIADHLDLADVGTNEARVLEALLEGRNGSVDAGFVATLRGLGRSKDYRAFLTQWRREGRGAAERWFLEDVVPGALESSSAGTHARRVLRLIRLFEDLTSAWHGGFDALLQALHGLAGRGKPDDVVLKAQKLLVLSGRRARELSERMAREGLLDEVAGFPAASAPLLDASRAIGETARDMAERALARHADVQQQRKRQPWIDAGPTWTLVRASAAADDEGETRAEGRRYPHSFRVTNVYSMLADLGRVTWEDADAEA